MKKHTALYLKHFGYETDDFIPCEFCWMENETNWRFISMAADIHHVEPRGMGGSKTKDFIGNLIGTCRNHHNDCENGLISKEKQKEIHAAFMEKFKK